MSNDNENNQQQATDHNRLAGLAGLESSGEESSYGGASLEDDGLEDQDLSEGGAWSNPFAKAGVVGMGTLIIAATGGALFGGINLSPNVAKTAIAEKSSFIEGDSPTDEKARLKTETALGKQEKALSSLRDPSPKVVPPPPQAPPRQVVVHDSPKTRPLRAQATRVQRPPEKAPEIPSNLAQLGSYGTVVGETTEVSQLPSTKEGKVQNFQDSQSFDDESPVLTGRAAKEVLVSSVAEGQITTPVATEGNQIKSSQTVIQLSSPVTYADGSIALPAGTRLVAQLVSISPNTGFMEMSVVSALVGEGGQRHEVKIPDGSIEVRGAQGKPLLASNIGDAGGEITRLQIYEAGVSGAEKAAELLNRPTSQVATSGVGGFSSATTNPDPNLLGGVIQGGASSFSQNLRSRNQREIQEATTRPKLWSIETGTPVQIYVKRSVIL